MARKNQKTFEASPEINVGGRPPKDPMEKLSVSIRAMTSPVVTEVLEAAQAVHGLPVPPRGRVSSDLLRLALYRYIEHMVSLDAAILGKITWEEFSGDPTWDSLKARGLV